MRNLLIALLLLCPLLASGQSLGASEKTPFGNTVSPEFLPIEEAYQLAVEQSGERTVRLYWQIADAYYLYQHAFRFKLTANGQALAAEPDFPAALERSDEYFGDVSVYYHQADITLTAVQAIPAGATLAVTFQGCADAGLCYPPETQYFSLDPGGVATRISRPVQQQSAANVDEGNSSNTGALPYMLLLAFLGGAILNLMPCVFPILSLKVLSFARSTDHDRHLHSWVYTAGVVFSFVAVAALLIALQRAGSAVGWGFQLQSPGFVIALSYLFLVMGLSLSGLVQLGGSLMNTGSGLADRGGLSGSFFTGVLAVIVASPCTAPFMGTALGFAVTQPAMVGLAVFAALGLGMAAPLLLFGYSGAARAIMPKPGPWMETLKQFLAFPLYAAAVWLLWVAGRQTGVNTMAAVLAGALVLTMGLWFWQQGGWKRVAALVCAVLAIMLGSARGLDGNGKEASRLAAGHLPFSEQSLAQLRREGTPVFVDVTADWCITCLANENAVLFTDEMTAAFEAHGVVYMVADWTNYDADIAGFISSHGRTGIPLYLMYPADPGAQPLILPQILTSDTVMQALQSVSGKKPELAGNLSEYNLK